MKSVQKLFVGTCLTLGIMFSATDILAGPPSGGGGGNPGCQFPPCVPIDGGLSILLAAGVALGGKKLHDHMKQG